MERLVLIGGLFVLAGLCEIGGGYLVWGWMREHKPLAWALFGAAILAAYGVVAALQPISEFGRVYAAYGGGFIALALASGVKQHYSPNIVEGVFSELRRGIVLGTSPQRSSRKFKSLAAYPSSGAALT